MTLEEILHLPVAELVPHAPPMVLLDRVLALGDEWCESELTLRPDSRFVVDGRVGGWVGIEYMAQTVAALSGAEALRRGEGIRVGLLLGTRQYVSHRPFFEVGMTLRMRVDQVVRDAAGLSVFDCVIREHPSGATLASAKLNAFLVADLEAYLKSQP